LEPDHLYHADPWFINVYSASILGIVVLIQIGLPGDAISASMDPSPLRWQNYPEALTYVPFWRFALNTLFIAGLAICGNLLSCTIIAYGFARLRAPGKNFLFILMLSTMMLVEPVRIIPLYIEFNKLGWIRLLSTFDRASLLRKSILYLFVETVFMNIPTQLEEAALIDGANGCKFSGGNLCHYPNRRWRLSLFQTPGVWNDSCIR